MGLVAALEGLIGTKFLALLPDSAMHTIPATAGRHGSRLWHLAQHLHRVGDERCRAL
jgi:hypothetical protein